jgi:hypothetical protein
MIYFQISIVFLYKNHCVPSGTLLKYSNHCGLTIRGDKHLLYLQSIVYLLFDKYAWPTANYLSRPASLILSNMIC